MNAASILALINAAASTVQIASAAYAEIKSTLSATDQATIEAQLAKLQTQSDADFTRVDAELGAAEATT